MILKRSKNLNKLFLFIPSFFCCQNVNLFHHHLCKWGQNNDLTSYSLRLWCYRNEYIVWFSSISLLYRISIVAQLVKNPPAMWVDLGSIPGLGRFPEEGKGYPLQYSGLKNSMGCIVHRVLKSWTCLNDFPLSLHFHFCISILKKHQWLQISKSVDFSQVFFLFFVTLSLIDQLFLL